jgi:hypothetical protein
MPAMRVGSVLSVKTVDASKYKKMKGGKVKTGE